MLDKNNLQYYSESLNHLSRIIHQANEKWWKDLYSGEPISRNMGELLMLCVSEIAEAMEGHRKNLPDDKLIHRSMFEVELADLLIRVLDIAGAYNLDLAGALQEKCVYNSTREDHTRKHRLSEHGKKY